MSISPSELRKHFLEVAFPLVEEYANAALGKSKLQSTNSDARTETWDLLKQLMLRSAEKVELRVTKIEDIFQAVCSGELTLTEGERLIKMYKDMKEVSTDAANVDSRPILNITLRDKDGEREVELESERRSG